EMLGNFSLGDYFKAEAITMAWELLTEVLGLEADRLWVTVHETDTEAAAIWVDKVGLAPERVQALGDEDNWWAMGDVGPCGPDSVFDTDVLRPVVAAAEAATGARYGAGGRADVGLRILADHARAMVFLISDGVLPANEARGYVLRRIIRRALRWGTQLGATGALGPRLAEAVVATMAPAYPELTTNASTIAAVVAAEEERFGRTLRAGQGL